MIFKPFGLVLHFSVIINPLYEHDNSNISTALISRASSIFKTVGLLQRDCNPLNEYDIYNIVVVGFS